MGEYESFFPSKSDPKICMSPLLDINKSFADFFERNFLRKSSFSANIFFFVFSKCILFASFLAYLTTDCIKLCLATSKKKVFETGELSQPLMRFFKDFQWIDMNLRAMFSKNVIAIRSR